MWCKVVFYFTITNLGMYCCLLVWMPLFIWMWKILILQKKAVRAIMNAKTFHCHFSQFNLLTIYQMYQNKLAVDIRNLITHDMQNLIHTAHTSWSFRNVDYQTCRTHTKYGFKIVQISNTEVFFYCKGNYRDIPSKNTPLAWWPVQVPIAIRSHRTLSGMLWNWKKACKRVCHLHMCACGDRGKWWACQGGELQVKHLSLL